MIRQRMGRLLLDAGCISEAQLQKALLRQQSTQGRLGTILVQQGALSEHTLLTFLGQQYGLPVLQDLPEAVDPSLAKLVPFDWSKQHAMVPIKQVGKRVTVAMVDPANVNILDELRFRTGCRIVPIIARESQIHQRIQQLYQTSDLMQDIPTIPSPTHDSGNGSVKSSEPEFSIGRGKNRLGQEWGLSALFNQEDIGALLERASSSVEETHSTNEGEPLPNVDAPIVDLVNKLLTGAVEVGASDIHLEPDEGSVRVRYRLDGVLHPVMTYPLRLRNAVISRLKILAKLDITERRLPQDGRLTFPQGPGRSLDVRLSILPCLHGEKAVLRLLNTSGLSLDLARLGLEKTELAKFLEAIEQPDGMILVTGPTGSGKTTTLYSALQVLNIPDVNIVTAEDPVEYHFTGVTQVQIREEIGLGFAKVLRSFLRQDPDIMMVGEIRDGETAQIAVKAALTGHRVLSTLHTTDAVQTVTRLLDMGVEPFLVASSVRLILAQRLVRKICLHCQRPDPVPIEQLVKVGFSKEDAPHVTPLRGEGCPSCHGTGYRGRVGLFEILPVSEAFRSLILQQPSSNVLKKQGIHDGLVTLRQSGLAKIKAGFTTVDEVIGVSTLD